MMVLVDPQGRMLMYTGLGSSTSSSANAWWSRTILIRAWTTPGGTLEIDPWSTSPQSLPWKDGCVVSFGSGAPHFFRHHLLSMFGSADTAASPFHRYAAATADMTLSVSGLMCPVNTMPVGSVFSSSMIERARRLPRLKGAKRVRWA